MKKLILFTVACAAIVACSKKDVPFSAGQTVTLSISTGETVNNDTKLNSALNFSTKAVDFTWEAGDEIKVTVGGSSSVFTLSKGEGTNNGEFTGVMPGSGTSFDVQFPVSDPDLSSQKLALSAIPKNKMKATATGCTIGSPFQLTPEYAALRLNLWGTEIIGKIVITNTSSAASPKPEYVLDCGEDGFTGITDEEATEFFIIVPAGTYKFKAQIYDNAVTPGEICSFETTTPQNFVAGGILNMPAKEVR